MKKLIAVILALSFPSLAMADLVYQSSYPMTNDVAVLKSQTSTNTISTQLIAIIVSSPTSTGVLKIFNSSFTTGVMSTVTIVGLTSVGYYPFNVTLKGITYSITNNSNGVNIIYKQ